MDCALPKADDFQKISQEDFENLDTKQNLIEKIRTLEKMLSLTDREIYDRKNIIADFTNLLRKYYPDCSITVFGSSANGFGFRGCDLDLLFLPFPEYSNLDFKGKGTGHVPNPYQVRKGRFLKENLLRMEEHEHLKFVQRVLYSMKGYFKRILFIPAKCPILNIQFLTYPISCDFSASNRLVVYNTQLLWLFGKLDHHVRPLVMVLRYWAKSMGFIKKTHLSSYAFTLMVLFYLQNTQPPILPSVNYLNKLAGFSRIIDGWETAICMDINYINSYNHLHSCKVLSLDELLSGFFDFYWNFDFIHYVVSLQSGKPLSVKELKESNDERIQSFKVTPFSIQDPFILSLNVSRNASMKTSFKLALLTAKKLLLKKNFPFHSLFDPTYYEKEMSVIYVPAKELSPLVPVCFPLQLTYETYCKYKISNGLSVWYSTVCQTILDVLQYGLLIECEVVDKTLWGSEPNPAKRRRISSDGLERLNFIMCIQCTANVTTLWSRKNAKNKLVNNDNQVGDLIDSVDDFKDDDELPPNLMMEYRISKEIIKEKIRPICKMSSEEFKAPYLWFMCNIFQYPFPEEVSDVFVSFTPLSDLRIFGEVKDIIKSFVQKHTAKILFGE